MLFLRKANTIPKDGRKTGFFMKIFLYFAILHTGMYMMKSCFGNTKIQT